MVSWHRTRTSCKQASFENSISGDGSLSIRKYLNYPMFSHLIIILSLRFWCAYSVPARRHCYLLSAIKQRFVQSGWIHFLCISAVWYSQLVWLFCALLFLFLDSAGVSDSSPQGGYSEGANFLSFDYLLFSSLLIDDNFLPDMGLCSETRSLQGSSA
jgi:hypothetical protein